MIEKKCWCHGEMEEERSSFTLIPNTLIALKGIRRSDTSWPQNVDNVLIFSFAGFVWLFLSIVLQQKDISASILKSLGRGHIGSLFTNEDQKKAGLGSERT